MQKKLGIEVTFDVNNPLSQTVMSLFATADHGLRINWPFVAGTAPLINEVVSSRTRQPFIRQSISTVFSSG